MTIIFESIVSQNAIALSLSINMGEGSCSDWMMTIHQMTISIGLMTR